MRLTIAAAFAALSTVAMLAGVPAAVAQTEDVERLRFAVVAKMPDGPPLQVRPMPPLPFEMGVAGGGRTTYAFGTMSVEQLEPDRFRGTSVLTRLKVQTAQGPVDTPLPNVTLTRGEVDAAGRYVVIERDWQGPPIGPPSPQLTQQTWSALRTGFQDASKDWLKVLENYEDTPVYRNDLTIGSLVGPANLAELLAAKLDQLDAMVRGNAPGYWGDLPRGSMTAARKDFLAGVIRTRGMPAAYESDVRIRGITTYAGRSFLLVSGALKKTPKGGPAVEGTLDILIDPASGAIGLYRRRTTYRGTGQSESVYVKLQLP